MNRKRIISTLLSFLVCALVIGMFAGSGKINALDGLEEMKWVDSVETREIYPGVKAYDIVTTESSIYKLERIHIVEFDPAQGDLYVDVTNMEPTSEKLKTVKKTMEDFTAKNGEGKTALAGVNGDMWMVSYAHARILGREDLLTGSYKSYAKDPVVKKSLTIPRGYVVEKGEIICTGHMSAETPYEGEFTSFGFDNKGNVQLGKPTAKVTLNDITSGATATVNGINRLPSANAIVMYTDKGPISNYALDDAYELIIDCDYDYVVRHGETIKGKIVAICKEGDEDMPMKENRIIITARTKKISKLEGFNVGDEVEIPITVKDGFKNDEFWQSQVYCAVGGHMEFFRDGKATSLGDTSSGYPTTMFATTKEGKVLFIVADGRQSGYSVGIPFDKYDELGKALGFEDAFIVDGGGSTTMVQYINNEYKLINRPSDKDSNGNYGSARTVVNTVILSYGADKNATPAPTPEPTPVPTEEVTVTEKPAENVPQEPQTKEESKGLSNTGIILIGVGAIAVIAAVALIVLKPWKKN